MHFLTYSRSMINKYYSSIAFKFYRLLYFRFGLYKLFYRLLGMKIGSKSRVPKLYLTWPHKVSIGDNCRLEHDIYFHYDGIYSPQPSIMVGNNVFLGFGIEFNIVDYISIGDNSLIASGVKFIDHDHNIEGINTFLNKPGVSAPIVVSSDVWIGADVIVLKGVSIGRGAIIASGAVVTKSIPDNEIWAGVPARCISSRSPTPNPS